MIITQPTKYYLVAGASDGFTELNAFDQSLLEAGVGDTNLVRMSSILPPSCEEIAAVKLPYGALVPVAYASMSSSQPGQWIAAGVAVGIPLDPSLPGLIMEVHGLGRRDEIAAKVREMAIRGMQYRNREIRDVQVIATEHRVEEHGAAFAGVVLWDGDARD